MTALTEKDSNAQLSPNKSQENLEKQSTIVKPYETKKHLLSKSSSTKSGGDTYVSPSDAIMSPASQKLASFKQKQITRQNDPARRSLFARELSSNSSNNDTRSLDSWQ